MADYGSLDHRVLSFAAEIRLVFSYEQVDLLHFFLPIILLSFPLIVFCFRQTARGFAEGISICLLLLFSIHLSISALPLFVVPLHHIFRYCQFIAFPLFVVRARNISWISFGIGSSSDFNKIPKGAFIFCSRTHTCMDLLLSLLPDVRSLFFPADFIIYVSVFTHTIFLSLFASLLFMCYAPTCSWTFASEAYTRPKAMLNILTIFIDSRLHSDSRNLAFITWCLR